MEKDNSLIEVDIQNNSGASKKIEECTVKSITVRSDVTKVDVKLDGTTYKEITQAMLFEKYPQNNGWWHAPNGYIEFGILSAHSIGNEMNRTTPTDGSQ